MFTFSVEMCRGITEERMLKNLYAYKRL